MNNGTGEPFTDWMVICRSLDTEWQKNLSWIFPKACQGYCIDAPEFIPDGHSVSSNCRRPELIWRE